MELICNTITHKSINSNGLNFRQNFEIKYA
jgi:hypothetical protein